MTRQIEMNFYANVMVDEDQPQIAGDLFGALQDAAPRSMHLENSTNTVKTASISATVSENTDSLFNDQ